MVNSKKEINRTIKANGITPSVWRRRYRNIFKGTSLKDVTVLDIGSGVGWASVYAALNGAKHVTSIEPEASGSRSEMLSRAVRLRDELGLTDVVTVKGAMLQEAGLTEKYDVVLLHNVINHLDEDACSRLHTDPSAWPAYEDFATLIRELVKPGGTLILADCSRRNLWNDLGLKNPIARTINWKIHQTPDTWAKMFTKAGFRNPTTRWSPVARLGPVSVLLTSPPAAYALTSHFCLTFEA